MNDLMLIKIIEKFDWSILEMAREIQKLENLVEQLADKTQEQKKEIKILESEEKDENRSTAKTI